MSKRPELTAAERALPYAKFYDLPITPIPEEKLAVLAAGPIDPSLALKIEDRNDLFKPGYLPCEIGYCVMPNGTGFLANRTEMPGVTPEMFEWWFAWHSLEDLRYRIWDPEDHYYARQQMREKTLDQSLPMRERTWGTVHHVLEDIGPGPEELAIFGEQYADTLRRMQTELSALERTVLMAGLEGRTPAQTARELGLPAKNVANALARARRKLRGAPTT